MLLSWHWIKFCTLFWCRIQNNLHFEGLLYLPCISKHRWTTETFDKTTVISSSVHQKIGLSQGSADRCEGDRNSDLIRLLRKYQAIHYCNQSVLAIFPELNIFVFIIAIVDIISRIALVQVSLLRASYLYNSTGLRFYILFSEPASHLCDSHRHGWVHYIDTRKIRF